MEHQQKSRKIQNSVTSFKAEIYSQQFHKNFNHLEKIQIPYIKEHLHHIKQFNHYFGMIPCPFCFNCYIHPGENLAQEINKKYNIKIHSDPYIFDFDFIRPGHCEKINKINNGFFICAQCQKIKDKQSIPEYFHNFLFFNGYHYTRKWIIPKVEMMDIPFNNLCLNCLENSKYRICYKCAGQRNFICCVTK